MEKLKVLLLEDNPNDAELIQIELITSLDYDFEFKRVETKPDFVKNIHEFAPQLILSDYSLPQYNGFDAIKDLQCSGSKIPIIIVTGSLSEELAAESIKAGAWDYVVKERLVRLPVAVKNVLQLKDEKFKQQQAQLQLQILSNAVNHAPSSIIITDQTGNIQYVNPKFEQVTGYTANEVIGKNPSILNSGYQPKEFYDDMWETLNAGNEWTGLFKNRKKNGEEIWENASISSIKNKKGDIQHFVAVKEDITDKVLMQEALEENELKYRSLVEDINDVLFELDIDGFYTYISPVITGLTGFPQQEYIGNHILDFVHPADLSKVKKDFNDLKDDKKYPSEYRMVKNDGTFIWIRSSSKLIYKTDTLIGIRGIAHNISKYKEFETELIQSKEKAEESDRLKSAFLTTMSHELRTPLNGIIGFGQLINESTQDEDTKEYSEIISKSGHRLLGIIEDMFDISIIESGEVTIEEEKECIKELINTIFEFTKQELKEENKTNIEAKMDFDPVLNSFCLESDIAKLKQVFTKIVKNAIKFTKTGSICIGAFLDKDEEINFYVKDTGIGIANDKKHLVFERFIQLDDSNTREFGGVGLGMHLSAKIMELLNGKIWFESDEGRGTTFFFTVPGIIKKKNNEYVTYNIDSDSDSDSTDIQNITILVAEDEEANFYLLDEILKTKHYKVLRAQNGLEAVWKVKDYPDIDLVLMDIRMPQMDGVEAAARIKEIRPALPIIALTAYAFAETREKIMKQNFVDYFSKPIERIRLLEAIKKHI